MDAWIPLFAVIVGVLASPLTTFTLEKLRYKQAKADATYAFQRQTLIELQEVSERISHFVVQTKSIVEIGFEAAEKLIAGDIHIRVQEDLSRLEVLSGRVMDEDLRAMVDESRSAYLQFGQLDIENWSDQDDINFQNYLEAFQRANKQMGYLIRETYQSAGGFKS